MYLHSVTLQENLLKPRVSEAQEGNASRKHNSSLTSTDIHNILHQAVTYKLPKQETINQTPESNPTSNPAQEALNYDEVASDASKAHEPQADVVVPAQGIIAPAKDEVASDSKAERIAQYQARAQNFQIEDDGEVRGLKNQFRTNISIIALLEQLRDEGRQATQDERHLLSRWTGWGGLAHAFYLADGSVAKGWEAEAQLLKEVLSEKEYLEARESTLSAYYTPKALIQAM